MSVGNQATSSTIDNTLTQYAIQLRDLLHKIGNTSKYMTKEGLTGLQGIGYSAADAQTALNDISFLNTFNLIFFNQGTQSATFDFNDALAHLYAGG